MSQPESFQPKCLKFEDWPEAHQAAWRRGIKKGDLFDEGGDGAHWRPRSKEKTSKGYGAWLWWNICRGVALETTQPADLVTQAAILAYIASLQLINSSRTIACRIQELYDAIRVMAPPRKGEHDWQWLQNAMKNLHADAQSSKDKRARLQTADDLERLGRDLMAQADTAPKRKRGKGLTDIQRALMYRDGLMISLLIRRPLRISNFCALRMNESLIIQEFSTAITFDADETKTHRPIEAPFPPVLRDALRHYIEHYRPILLNASQKAKGIETDALWISRDGTELVERSFHGAIRRRTQAAFGAPLPPHWFRDASVTTLVHDAPESARLTMGLLGHSSPEIGEKHYNQALMIDSARKYAGYMEGLFNLTGLETERTRNDHE